jgi:hypothetical protein
MRWAVELLEGDVVVYSVQPEFSEQARQSNFQGTHPVAVQIIVDADFHLH